MIATRGLALPAPSSPAMPLINPLVAGVMVSAQVLGLGNGPVAVSILLLAAVWLLYQLSRPFAPVRSPGFVMLVSAFLGTMMFSNLDEVWNPLKLDGLVVNAAKLLLVVLLVQILDDSQRTRRAVVWFLVSTSMVATIGILQVWIYRITGQAYHFADPDFAFSRALDGTITLRATGFSRFADQFAQPLSVAAALGVYLGFARGRSAERWAYLGVAALCSYGVWLAVSRASWTAIGAGLLAMPAIAAPRFTRRYALLLAVLGGLFVFSGALNWALERAGSLGTHGLSERVILMAEGLRVLMDHPWNGVGVLAFGDHSPTPERYPVHNAAIQIGSELGIPGLIAFGAVILWVLVRLVIGIRAASDARTRSELKGLLAGLIGLTVMIQSQPLAYAQFLWIYFALCECAAAGVLRDAEMGGCMGFEWMSEYARIAWRHRMVIALSGGFAGASALGLSQFSRPIYEAVTEFYVAPALPPVGRYLGDSVPLLSVLEQMLLPAIGGERDQMFAGLLQSQAVGSRALEAASSASGDGPWRIDIQPTRGHLLQVRVLDHDAQYATRVANAYPQALADFLAHVAKPHEEQGIASAEQAVERATSALESARADLQKFLEQVDTPDLNASIAENVSRRNTLGRDIEEARVNLQSVENRILAAEDRLRRESNLIVSSEQATQSTAARSLMLEIDRIQEDLALARARGAEVDDIAALDRRLRERKAGLASEMEKLVSQTQRRFERRADSLDEMLRRQVVAGYVDRAALEAEIAAKTRALTALERDSGDLPSQRLREEFLRAEIQRFGEMVHGSTLNLEEARAQVAEASSNIVLVGEAEPSPSPVYPLPGAAFALGVLFGLAAGVYAAFALEYWEQLREQHPAFA